MVNEKSTPSRHQLGPAFCLSEVSGQVIRSMCIRVFLEEPASIIVGYGYLRETERHDNDLVKYLVEKITVRFRWVAICENVRPEHVCMR